MLNKFVAQGEYVLMIDARWNKSAQVNAPYRELCIVVNCPVSGINLLRMQPERGLEVLKQACILHAKTKH